MGLVDCRCLTLVECAADDVLHVPKRQGGTLDALDAAHLSIAPALATPGNVFVFQICSADTVKLLLAGN